MPESIKGLKALLKKLDNLDKDLFDKIDLVVNSNGQEMLLNARKFAPKDTGHLAQTIGFAQSIEDKNAGVSSRTVVANAKYAPYQEFGTGGLVEVPPELQDTAIQFKGKGIRKVNMKPHAFLWPALVLQRPEFIKDLEKLLKSELGKI